MFIFKSNLSNKRFMNEKNKYNEEYLAQLNGEYEALKNTSLPILKFSDIFKFRQTGERLPYEKKYFKRRAALRDFALVYWIYGDKEARAKLEDIMWDICGEFSWVLPAHMPENIFDETIDLFAAETAQSLAEIISLVGEDLNCSVVERSVSEITKRVLNPFLSRTKPYNWESMNGNWCAVCGGCIGMTALYLIENEDLLNKVIDNVKPVIDRYIDSFPDDGACLEGLYYWNYGMMYFTAFVDLYKQRMGKDFPIDEKKVRKIAEFAGRCCIGHGYTVSFSDGYEKDKIYSGLMYKLKDLFNTHPEKEEYTAPFLGDDCGRWCKAARDIAWTKNEHCDEEKKNVFFFDAQWAIMRQGLMKAAMKGGNNAEPHNHNDIGSVIILKDKDMLLCDIGAGEYTSDYFSDNRYSIFCTRSLGHSVPIINGHEQRTGESFKCENFVCDNNRVISEIGGAYGIKELKSCMRTLICEDNITVIRDEFDFDGDFEVTERFITRCEAFADGQRVKLMSNGDCKAEMYTDNDCNIEIGIQTHREHDGRESKITTVDFKFSANNTYKFLVKIS